MNNIFKGSLMCLAVVGVAIGISYSTANDVKLSDAETMNDITEYIDVDREFVSKLGYDPTYNIFTDLSQVTTYSINDYSYEYVYTPNNTVVQVIKFDSDLEPYIIAAINEEYDSKFPEAERLSSATKYYNCHSYAWYEQSTNNPYWMDNPAAYYSDGSYIETTTPEVGDIVCYYSSSNLNLHSGVIVEVNGNSLSTIVVESKWGQCGLYSHTANYCPYMPAYGGDTAYVKYYKYNHTHIYNQNSVYINYKFHRTYCECGSVRLFGHSIRRGDAVGRYANCVSCGGLLDLEEYTYPSIFSLSTLPATENGSYILPSGLIVLAEADIVEYLSGTLYIDGILVA